MVYQNTSASAKLLLKNRFDGSILKRGGTQEVARLRIREIAEQRGMSMGELSRKSNVTLAVIRRIWRNDQHNVEFSTLQKIAAALGCDVRDLIEDGGKA
jgi:DNA-binding Xre family transcriptional regulator